MYAWVCDGVQGSQRGSQILWNWRSKCLWTAMWVLGHELRSFARSTSLICWPISLAPPEFCPLEVFRVPGDVCPLPLMCITVSSFSCPPAVFLDVSFYYFLQRGSSHFIDFSPFCRFKLLLIVAFLLIMSFCLFCFILNSFFLFPKKGD